jgi:hypothetical protein
MGQQPVAAVALDLLAETHSPAISHPPLSLKKMGFKENVEVTVISYTSENEFFQGKIATFSLMRFFLECLEALPAMKTFPIPFQHNC